jgi:hypothetical protein
VLLLDDSDSPITLNENIEYFYTRTASYGAASDTPELTISLQQLFRSDI